MLLWLKLILVNLAFFRDEEITEISGFCSLQWDKLSSSSVDFSFSANSSDLQVNAMPLKLSCFN